ncbi:CaiB/BaiF CoA transferase family protein [Sphingosinicella soli]|uniref:CoA:oxalate CoA-transferase n=1 Tax=Sphingosinicella soli TaxID=333708 RepID=A0A7W7AYS8_9SPHN|nr:CaiB/BaiF CoA-transferase family protein [Sphingosinicella soli]MBB4630853.1 CoA:oxalate CoA-transferase [Sphingosinicella soli]
MPLNVDGNETAGPASPRTGPLTGIVVLDVTRVVAGPFCAMILADMGATVIKIENPKDPDYTRTFPPMVNEGESQTSAFYAQYNRNKLGVSLDLRSADGKEIFKRLVRKADILIENFRPGVMDKFGLGYDDLKHENPRLVYAGISGFGRTGPNSRRPGYDNSGQATGGLWSMNGYPGQPPVRVGTIIGDLSAALYAAIGILAALREAERTGIGQVVDISQQDAVLSLTESAVVRYTVDKEIAGPLGNDHPFVRPYGQFPCADGYVFFGGYTDKFWAITCALFGEPGMATDPRIDTMEKRFDPEVSEKIVNPLLERWFGRYTKAQLEAMAGDDVPLSAIKSIDEVIADPHIEARGMIVDVPVGGRDIRMLGLPIKLSGATAAAHDPAPSLGEHNAAVLQGMLGLDDAALAALREDGVI